MPRPYIPRGPRRTVVPHGEITHFATVQFRGWIENTDHAETATRSRSFTNETDALNWIKQKIENAHGGELTVNQHAPGITTVTTTDGPTWGMVVDVEAIRG